MYNSYLTNIDLHYYGGLCVIGTYLLGGITNVLNWDNSLKFIESKQFKLNPTFILVIGIVWQLAGGIMALTQSYKHHGYILLILFTILSNYNFYQFWKMEGVEKHINTILFLSNIGLIGGCLLLL